MAKRNRETSTAHHLFTTHSFHSLRGQLMLIPTALLILGLIATISVVLVEAKGRIAAEITSAMELGHDLAASTLRNVAGASTQANAFEQLERNLPRVRHVQFELVASDGRLIRDISLQGGLAQPDARPWIARLLAPASVEQTFPVVVHGVEVGHLRILSDSANEIAEIVGEVKLFAAALSALGLLLIGGLLWTVRRALRPVQALADGFDRLECGDYRPIAPITVLELQRVAHQFNHLAQSLQQAALDNHFLIDKLLSLQEEERKTLAADLHDEFGPMLFGVRADAATILKSVSSGTEVHARAQSINALADGMQKANYRILDRLRPLVLEQMGLCQALRHQVNSWRATYPHITWSLDISPAFTDPAEMASLTLYRAAQESAINAVRHAHASLVAIRLERHSVCPLAGAIAISSVRRVILSVQDDGRGLPDGFRRGFGLLGLNERVRQLGGSLEIRELHPGVAIEVTIPEEEQ